MSCINAIFFGSSYFLTFASFLAASSISLEAHAQTVYNWSITNSVETPTPIVNGSGQLTVTGSLVTAMNGTFSLAGLGSNLSVSLASVGSNTNAYAAANDNIFSPTSPWLSFNGLGFDVGAGPQYQFNVQALAADVWTLSNNSYPSGTFPYANTVTFSATLLPEIDSATLPKAALLLVSLYLLAQSRRHKIEATNS